MLKRSRVIKSRLFVLKRTWMDPSPRQNSVSAPSSWPLRLPFNWLSKITRAHPSVPPRSGNPGDEAATCTCWRALRGPRCGPATSASPQYKHTLSLCWCGLLHHLYVKPMWEGAHCRVGLQKCDPSERQAAVRIMFTICSICSVKHQKHAAFLFRQLY